MFVARSVTSGQMRMRLQTGIPLIVRAEKYTRSNDMGWQDKAGAAREEKERADKDARRSERKKKKEDAKAAGTQPLGMTGSPVAHDSAGDAAALQARWEAEEDRVAEIADTAVMCSLQNIAADVRESDIRAMLVKYGEVQQINMVKSSLNPLMVNVQIMFATDMGARQAVEALQPWLKIANERQQSTKIGGGLGGGRKRRQKTIRSKSALSNASDMPAYMGARARCGSPRASTAAGDWLTECCEPLRRLAGMTVPRCNCRSVELAAMVPPRTPSLDHAKLVSLSEDQVGPQ